MPAISEMYGEWYSFWLQNHPDAVFKGLLSSQQIVQLLHLFRIDGWIVRRVGVFHPAKKYSNIFTAKRIFLPTLGVSKRKRYISSSNRLARTTNAVTATESINETAKNLELPLLICFNPSRVSDMASLSLAGTDPYLACMALHSMDAPKKEFLKKKSIF
jgi:hypothetical protein